jgi:TRAP-type mannitol/chloroaromatic compound transport system permease small subunit
MSAPGEPPTVGRDAEHIVDEFVHTTSLPETRLSLILDGIVRRIGDIVSWVWVVLVGVIVFNVIMRYVFGEGRIEFEELQWHLYALGFVIGLSYCVQNDSHIRIDILHEQFRPRTKAWVDFVGILVFLIPYITVFLVYAPPFLAYSFNIGEVSDAPGGLSHRWIIKSVMVIGYVLLLLAALSRLSRTTAELFGFPAPLPRRDDG